MSWASTLSFLLTFSSELVLPSQDHQHESNQEVEISVEGTQGQETGKEVGKMLHVASNKEFSITLDSTAS